MNKIKCIVKRPDEKIGHMTYISNTLENLQKTVGGYIEVVRIGGGCLLIVNEEGKQDGLERNFQIGHEPVLDIIVGTCIICGENGDEFADIPISRKVWASILQQWGNEI